MSFKKAVKKQVKLKIEMTGPSGSGKTMSALRLATGFGGKIALIDSENESASLYADDFEFDTMNISAPYTTEKYNSAVAEAVKGGYDWVIIDSATHAWAGSGGLLEQKEQLDSRMKGGNSYTNWAPITKKQEAFLAAQLHSNIHLITTVRSKQDYVIVEKNGKSVPQKVGLAPVQREGMEYEFTVVFDIAMNNEAEASKDRTKLFKGRVFTITEDTGKELRAWLESGVKMESNPMEAQAAQPDIDPEDMGSFVCKVGQKHTGKRLKDFDIFELDSFIKNTKKWFADEKKKPSADWIEFFEVAEAYLSSKEVPSGVDMTEPLE